jgi:hypothetical protein
MDDLTLYDCPKSGKMISLLSSTDPRPPKRSRCPVCGRIVGVILQSYLVLNGAGNISPSPRTKIVAAVPHCYPMADRDDVYIQKVVDLFKGVAQ